MLITDHKSKISFHINLLNSTSLINVKHQWCIVSQIDLASPKKIGGLLSQGGSYEEKIQGLYPKTESWPTEFVISYANSTAGGHSDFHYVKNQRGDVRVTQYAVLKKLEKEHLKNMASNFKVDYKLNHQWVTWCTCK